MYGLPEIETGYTCPTRVDAEPESIFLRLTRAQYFTNIDLIRGYWQIKLHPDCKHLTVFSSLVGQL